MRRIVLVLIGLVLLGAGLAKIAALSGPVDSLGWPREMIVAGSAAELLLGAWLLSGAAIRLAHLAAIGMFLLFALLSTWQVVQGVPSCGCLGKLYVHPAWMLGFDLLTLGMLVALWFVAGRRQTPSANDPTSPSPETPERRHVLIGGTLAFMTAVAIASTVWSFAGSFDGALGIASGHQIVMSPSIIDLGSGSVGETKHANLHIVNASALPVRIIGSENSCGCVMTDELPLTIAAGRSVRLPIDLTVRAEGSHEVVLNLFTDRSETRTLSSRILLHGSLAPLTAGL